MIWHTGAKPATMAELRRNNLIREMHCMCCALKGDLSKKKVEIHHLISGNRRMGHLYTIPLCTAHHRGQRGDKEATEPHVHGGMKAFRAHWGYDDRQLWQKLQVMLGMDDSLPKSKIFKRIEAQTEAERSMES